MHSLQETMYITVHTHRQRQEYYKLLLLMSINSDDTGAKKDLLAKYRNAMAPYLAAQTMTEEEITKDVLESVVSKGPFLINTKNKKIKKVN